MMQIVALVFVLALVYAIKTISVMRQHEELAQDCASFSWMHAREEDVALAESWATEEETEAIGGHVGVGHMRHAGMMGA